MKKGILYGAWALMYVLCAVLGLVAEPTDAQSVAMTLLSLVFFLPPAWLLVDAIRQKDFKTLGVVRIVSLLSLILTTAAYIANLASVGASETVGNVLYYVLLAVSAPMVSMGIELLSLFFWACLLFGSFSLRNRK